MVGPHGQADLPYRVWRRHPGIQSELVQEIATALQATLLPEERARVQAVRTDKPEAQMLYWQARDFQNHPTLLLASLCEAERLYKQAVAIDPNFATAYARLAQTVGRIAFNYEPSDARYAAMFTYAQKALALQPDSGEVHIALGSYHYWKSHGYPRSLEELTLAQRALPKDTEVLRAIGYVQRRQGRWAAARANCMMLAGLMSRWMRSAAPAAMSAWVTWRATSSAKSGDRCPRRRTRSARVSPSMNSIA